ncbi:MAG: non-heme iron oxygenase ferredoxin subunit [Roseomonas sp.]|jgi:nitrite reductase/ring-hydroxylating ferredoxin subunit|nr:non-heme iron oxygenase ferredoxin subunit [Roseomonas sp.]MCA3286290.1 non-heme iron oxygenase ferredoxin subunit [Roseomonas sp.]MCA3291207.1 non-heme iron oxygenase ferredoxin subunit [Roseomonas sp.]MCA3296396.1 non-heme iron oxygenase ferredoxin subunit [Roseomonas sp.]MCA4919251.1 non-heme iron oxygenase ferredoxin subunit [Roseomonas sp.]
MKEWHRVASEEELQPDTPFAARIGEMQLAIIRLADGIFAVNDVCSHEYALLSEGFCEDGKLECPLHQACFDIRTGQALSAPATTAIATYQVKCENGDVLVMI